MTKLTKLFSSKKGFTLLEILLVVGIISILAGIVILAINPGKQLADTRNAQRRSDVITILNAVYQYEIDHNGDLPSTIVTTFNSSAECTLGAGKEIGNGEFGGAQVNLYTSLVGTTSPYLPGIPSDPKATSTSQNDGSGYVIGKTPAKRITVCAPLAENGATIFVTR